MKYFKYMFFLICIFFAKNILAQELYHIEIIVFEQDPVLKTQEDWPLDPGKLKLENAQTLNVGEVQELPKAKWQLNETAKAIKKNRNLHIIHHTAWIQPLMQGSKSKPVYVDTYNNVDFKIMGTLAIKPVKNLFHTYIDFIFDHNNSKFRLTSNGKLKQKELYYFDHPIFGVLVMVMPDKST